MTRYDYKVIPAPRRLRRVKGVAGGAELFAHTLTETINDMARHGWEYLRSEAMVVEGPRRLFRAAPAVEHTVLVFRRPQAEPETEAEPEPSEPPEPEALEDDRPLLRRGPRLEAGEMRAATPLRPGPRLGPANKS